MKATPKQWAFLGVFTVAVAAICAVVIHRAVGSSPSSRRSPRDRPASSSSATLAERAPSSSTERTSTAWRSASRSSVARSRRSNSEEPSTRAPSRRAPQTIDTPKLVTYSLDEYMAIADRDPFKPIRSQSRSIPVEIEGPSPLTPQEPEGSPNPSLPPPPSDLPPPPPVDTPPPGPESPQPQDVAVTGFVESEEGVFILLENVETQEGRVVRPGDEEFGYRVQYVDQGTGQVVLQKDGREIRLRLGDNKKEAQPAKKPPEQGPSGSAKGQKEGPPQPGGGSGGPGSGGNRWLQRLQERYGGQVPPEIMRRYEEWQRRRNQR